MVVKLLSNKHISLNVFAENDHILEENNTIGHLIFNICEVILVSMYKIFECAGIFFDYITYTIEKRIYFRRINNFMYFLNMSLKSIMNILTVMYDHFVWWLIDHSTIEFSKSNRKEDTEEYGENTRFLLSSLSLSLTYKVFLNGLPSICRESFAFFKKL
ncbi:Hypothetical protein SRAE_1000206400 [Strongyloides ratti]|uniref:Uncharacterized protein n=1 Tax=Strongyloides ratti TaxID=34506 RepID=A0A090L1X6_STRRB|nr:Hypothetical protein SRAE_1000206400 [Strongyloides ratti]CEF63806.1 Hypothetical protein SRAE_1000206400 [Strongyloides ratti]